MPLAHPTTFLLPGSRHLPPARPLPLAALLAGLLGSLPGTAAAQPVPADAAAQAPNASAGRRERPWRVPPDRPG